MDVSWLSAILLGAAGCIAIGYILGTSSAATPIRKLLHLPFRGASLTKKEAAGSNNTITNNKSKSSLVEVEKLAEILEDFKMVLVVRNDLKMGKGKIAAQCSHATLGLYKKLLHRAPKALNRWEMCGQVKVVLKSESEDDLLVLQERAKSLNLPTHITIDAGRTQIAPNSRTVMALLGEWFTFPIQMKLIS
ncbi:hypothetical protein IFM89_031036 [Coptis chinensis]|uniref:peptidyl-tRNA hydrolase n=1 Tax=Coptis chinensis TaxID=261450 RepID=A0A835H7V9_9MAGN|nr:hypothetical protein IFM89_031036 [Coptis chinensis]